MLKPAGVRWLPPERSGGSVFPGAKAGCVNVGWKRGICPSQQNYSRATPSYGAREGMFQRLKGEPQEGS